MNTKRRSAYRCFLLGLILFGGVGSFVRFINDIDIYDSGRTYVFRQKETWPPNMTQSGYDYLVRLPKGYTDFGTPHPLIIYLHGAGETGKDVEILRDMDVYYFGQGIFTQEDASRPSGGEPLEAEGYRPPRLRGFSFIVVSPMTPKHGWEPKQVIRLLDELLDKNTRRWNIDPSRIYLTGFSMGGFGTFRTAAAYPDRFAAVVPVAGGGDVAHAERLKHIPLWVFHGDADNVVPIKGSQEMIDAIKTEGGRECRMTVYPNAGHGINARVYRDKEVYNWLLKQHSIP
ncbi:MAG: prolyl oligopeptidase family serine peptidase [Planctomycetaceae bacterium]|nr:prolyl oligopeptidase family serine peptidase [Planctomycetaceae bacterium]